MRSKSHKTIVQCTLNREREQHEKRTFPQSTRTPQLHAKQHVTRAYPHYYPVQSGGTWTAPGTVQFLHSSHLEFSQCHEMKLPKTRFSGRTIRCSGCYLKNLFRCQKSERSIEVMNEERLRQVCAVGRPHKLTDPPPSSIPIRAVSHVYVPNTVTPPADLGPSLLVRPY